MKKIWISVIIGAMAITIVACGTKEKESAEPTTEPTETVEATELPEETQELEETEEPKQTEIVEETKKPEETEGPAATEEIEITEQPMKTEKVTKTEEPEKQIEEKVTEKPEITEQPTTKKPSETKKPTVTKKPKTTKKPAATKKPETTKKPTATKKPEVTKKPTATKKPEATKKPTATKKPEATKKPTATKKPEITKEPQTEVSVNDITTAVKEAFGENYLPSMSIDDETLKNLFGVSSDWCEAYYGELPMISAHIDRFLAIKAKDGKAGDVEAALQTYQEVLKADTMQYPMSRIKILASKVVSYDNYVFFIMLGESPDGLDESITEEDMIKFCEQQNDIAISAIKKALGK